MVPLPVENVSITECRVPSAEFRASALGTRYSIFNATLKTGTIVYHHIRIYTAIWIYNFASFSVVEYRVPSTECRSPYTIVPVLSCIEY